MSTRLNRMWVTLVYQRIPYCNIPVGAKCKQTTWLIPIGCCGMSIATTGNVIGLEVYHLATHVVCKCRSRVEAKFRSWQCTNLLPRLLTYGNNIGRILASAGLGFFTQTPLGADCPFLREVFGFVLENGRPHEKLLRSDSLSYTVEHST